MLTPPGHRPRARFGRGAWVHLLALALAAAVVGCDDAADDLDPRRPPVDAAVVDGAVDPPDHEPMPDADPDVALPILDAEPPDAAPDAAPDAEADARLLDAEPADAEPADAALDATLADATLADAGLDRCAAWDHLAGAALVDALHAELHATYRPIAVELDRGGNPNRYTTARHLMFTVADLTWDRDDRPGNVCLYTGRFVASPPDEEPDDEIMNCEHTWPRARMSPEGTLRYSHEQSDIHHLRPTISGANSLRGSFPFGDVVQNRNLDHLPAILGVDAWGDTVFQTRAETRGDVARIVFYFSVRWGKPIADHEEAALRRWMREDPVDDEERARNDRVEGIQGNRNPFIDCPALVERIDDFAAFDALDTEANLPAP
ncbi:MAG: endonuclease [bacterium]